MLATLALAAKSAYLSDARAFEDIELHIDDILSGAVATPAAVPAVESALQRILESESALEKHECVALAAIKEAEMARAMGLCSSETVGRLYRLWKAIKLPSKTPRASLDSNLMTTMLRKLGASGVDVLLVTAVGASRMARVPEALARRVCADAVYVVPPPARATLPPITVSVPGSKSVSNRALLLAALSPGTCLLKGLLHSDDTQVMMSALEQLGASFAFEGGGVRVTGNAGVFAKPKKPLYMGNAGTATRFVISLCVLVRDASHVTEVQGSHRMLERPQGPLVDALRSNGCKIRYRGEAGTLPLDVSGGGLRGGDLQMSGKVSSQFVSSVLLAAPYAAAPLTLTLDEANPTSLSYIEMTLQTMAQFGVAVERLDVNKFRVPLGGYRAPAEYMVEADASSATYPLAMAAVTGRRVTVLGVGNASLQGDAAFCHLLGRMGCVVEQTATTTTVTGPASGAAGLRPVSEDMGPLTDAFLTAAVVAALSEGRTHLHGIANQHVKECDRIKAMCAELAKVGVRCENLPDGIVIHGKAEPEAFRCAFVDTYDDHRIAMSFAVLGCRLANVLIQDKDCTDKTYPEFWDDVVNKMGFDVAGVSGPLAPPWTEQTLVVVGMRGAGKTTMSRVAAKHLGFECVDMDDEMVKANEGKSVQAIVAELGWPAFRAKELALLADTLEAHPRKTVVACGGGIVETLEARRLLCAHQGPVLHVQRHIEDVLAFLEPASSPTKVQRTDAGRPSLGEPADKVWARRKPWYAAVSTHDFCIPLAGSEAALATTRAKAELDVLRTLDNMRRVATPNILALREAAVLVELKEPVAETLAQWRHATPMHIIARGSDASMLVEALRSAVEAIELPAAWPAHAKALVLSRAGPCLVETEFDPHGAFPQVRTRALGTPLPLPRVFLFGHPIAQSPSPVMHNTAFELLGKQRLYELCDCNDVERVARMLKLPVLLGASVTIPFKESVMAYMDVVSPEAKAIGAVNTVLKAGGKLLGHNTDWMGIVNLLRGAGVQPSQAGKSMLVVGAGGTARAACFAAKQLGLSLLVWNRTRARARELAEAFGGTPLVDFDSVAQGSIVAIVGTVPASAGVTVPASVLVGKPVVLDAAYRPRETTLLRDAKAHGCTAIEGVHMLIEQGLEQMRIWDHGAIEGGAVADDVKQRVRAKVLEWYDAA